ncbi:MAG: hypothetical protein J6Y08_02340 [Clostridiales bacterium]|nr:hypothetical protein [Clostridiales bacterium]
MNKKPLSIGIKLLLILLLSCMLVACVVSIIYMIWCIFKYQSDLVFTVPFVLVSAVASFVLVKVLIRDKELSEKLEKSGYRPVEKPRTNYIKKYAAIYTKNYTNKRICDQIEDNSAFFRTIMCIVLICIVMIILGYGINDTWIYLKYPPCVVFGITFLIVMWVGICTFGSLNMFKHIRPSCSGKRYSAKEIDDMANHPDTVWQDTLHVFYTPKALIGINKGLTVVDYEDIADIKCKKRHHSRRLGPPSRTAGHIGRSIFHAIVDHYKEWDTFIIIVKTKTHKRMVLTEADYEGDYKRLLQFLEERKSSENT